MLCGKRFTPAPFDKGRAAGRALETSGLAHFPRRHMIIGRLDLTCPAHSHSRARVGAATTSEVVGGTSASAAISWLRLTPRVVASGRSVQCNSHYAAAGEYRSWSGQAIPREWLRDFQRTNCGHIHVQRQGSRVRHAIFDGAFDLIVGQFGVSAGTEAVLLLWAICWIDELASARSVAADLDYHWLTHFDEVGDIGGFSIEASGGQGLQCPGIKLLAVTRVPGAGEDRDLAIVRMSVSLKLVARREFQAKSVRARLGWISNQGNLLHARQCQSSLRAPLHFLGCDRHHIRLGLSAKTMGVEGKSGSGNDRQCNRAKRLHSHLVRSHPDSLLLTRSTSPRP